MSSESFKIEIDRNNKSGVRGVSCADCISTTRNNFSFTMCHGVPNGLIPSDTPTETPIFYYVSDPSNYCNNGIQQGTGRNFGQIMGYAEALKNPSKEKED